MATLLGVFPATYRPMAQRSPSPKMRRHTYWESRPNRVRISCTSRRRHIWCGFLTASESPIFKHMNILKNSMILLFNALRAARLLRFTVGTTPCVLPGSWLLPTGSGRSRSLTMISVVGILSSWVSAHSGHGTFRIYRIFACIIGYVYASLTLP